MSVTFICSLGMHEVLLQWMNEKSFDLVLYPRIGRGHFLVPLQCILRDFLLQAYFPPISQPEGLPIKIQDSKGNEWHLQFRFWPNNNSRMYVLEGVTPCIQSLQLQAGDTGNLQDFIHR